MTLIILSPNRGNFINSYTLKNSFVKEVALGPKPIKASLVIDEYPGVFLLANDQFIPSPWR